MTDGMFGGIPGGSYGQDHGAGLPPGMLPPPIPGASFQDAGAGLPPGGYAPVAPPYFQDHGAGLTASKLPPTITPGTYLTQDHGARLPADRFPPGVPVVNLQDAGVGLRPGSFARAALPGDVASLLAPPEQLRIGRPQYDRAQPPTRPTCRPQTTRHLAKPAPTANRNTPPRRSSSIRVTQRPARIKESRQELRRSNRRLSAVFCLWLAVSLISTIWAFHVMPPPAPSKSSLVYITQTSAAAPYAGWWFFGSCLSALVAAACLIANQQKTLKPRDPN